jgi:hypothetical protein
VIVQSNAVAWETSLDQARERARRERKALLLDFRADPTSPACLAMDSVAYLDPQVVTFLHRHVVPVRLVRIHQGAGRRYDAKPVPITDLGDRGEGPHYRVDGFVSPKDFVARLGLGRYRFDRHEFAEAVHHFQDLADRYEGTRAAAQAFVWLGVARFKQSIEPAQPRPTGAKLYIGDAVGG